MALLAKVKDIFKGGSSAKKKKLYHNVKLENPEDNWEVIGELGDGAYGKVYKAMRRDNSQLAALKQVVLEGEDDLETYMVEVDILAECKHPNIVELLEAYHYDGKLWMYLEYCDGGAVDSIMVDLDRPLTEPQISTLCYGICNALIYVHANKVIHRDLKAGNVLLTMEGGVKLADFGVSAKNKNTYDKRGTFIGTPYWLAPEVILCETFIDAKYDYKADIWSLGISLIEFAQMDPPNHEVSPVRVMLKIQKSDPPKLDYPSRWSKEFNDFVAKCLTKDPEHRPTAEDLLKHPFLNKQIDRKAIVDLLLEYKADVVEEEVDDDLEKGKAKKKLLYQRVDTPPECTPNHMAPLPEDQDPSRLSRVSEAFTNTSSRYDTDSIISIDKDSTLQNNGDDKQPNSTSEEKSIAGSVPPERKISKGPAPPPPAVSASAQATPKKGPAPAVPSVSVPSDTSQTDTPVSLVASGATPNDAVLVDSTHNVVIDSGAVPVPVSSPEGDKSFPDLVSTASVAKDSPDTPSSPIVASPEIPSTPVVESPTVTPVTAPSSPPAVTPAAVSTTHIPDQPESTEIFVASAASSPSEGETNVIDSIPVAKSVVVFDSDTVAVVSHASGSLDVEMRDVTIPSASGGGASLVSLGDTTEPEFPQPPASSMPVTLSVVTPNKGVPSDMTSSQGSDVLLASISSEGTVIVRTPTPTPSASAVTPTPSSTSLDAQQTPSKMENVVTYTVAEGSGNDLKSDSCVHVGGKESSQVPEEPSIEEASLQSLGEAESQAVLILERAIDSALDSSFALIDDSSSPTPSSATIEDEQAKENQGVVVVASVPDPDVGVIDVSAHKLDESEVLISSSSIPEDEQKDQLPSKMDIPIEDESPSVSLDDTVTSGHEDEAHVSVVAVAEAVDEVTIVTDEANATKEVIVEGGAAEGTQQVSLTIEGTTVGDTDVDEVESATTSVSDMPLSSQSPVNAHVNREPHSPSDGSPTSPVTPTFTKVHPTEPISIEVATPKAPEEEGVPLKPIQNGVRRQNSRASDRSDTDTTSTVGSDKENRNAKEDSDLGEEVTLRRPVKKANATSPATAAKNLKNKELQESIALRKKTRKRTRKFVIDGVVVTTTTSKVIYGDDEEQGMLSSAHLKRKQELRELKLLQKREQKQFQDLSLKANIAKQEQEKKFEIEKSNLLRNYESQIESLTRQQKQMVEKAEGRQESEMKSESKKTRSDQERELKAFRESLKQEWKLLKQEVDRLPKDRRKENFKIRKEQLEREQAEKEKDCLERLNDSHEMALKLLNDKHRQHIALKERQFLEEKHQLLRSRESALWNMEERHIQDKHQLAKEQLKDIYFLQRLQMTIRHNIELEQVRRYNQQKEEDLLKRQQEERRQLPKRIRQEMKTREKMFREQIRISMTNLSSHDQEKDQLKKFQEQEKIKYDKERKRAELKHKKQMEELHATTEASIKELVHLQNEKGKLLTEHETYKLKSLDDEYQKELKEWKSNLAPRKQKLEEDFDRQLKEQEKFYGDYLDRGIGTATPSHSTSSLASSHHSFKH